MFFNFFRKNYRWKDLGDFINPDDIFLDSSNLPEFNVYQFEGQLERTISQRTIFFVGAFFSIILISFIFKIDKLQIIHGEEMLEKGENNRLEHSIVFPERGIIYDRNGVLLAWNSPDKIEGQDFLKREYLDTQGIAHILGYLSYPQKDSTGNYFQDKFLGMGGVEDFFNEKMSGQTGLKIVEKDALFEVKSESTTRPAKEGESLVLSLDYRLQNAMYGYMKELSERVGFIGGAGVIMNVENGEIITMVSYPEFDSKIMTEKEDKVAIKSFSNDKKNPFLNRVTSGLFTPGSIIKPFLALGALNEGIITPEKQILSTGSISIQNPYFPDQKTVFKDWKAHGWVNMIQALAVSSDVYFYEVGGGYEDQKGLGIEKINEYVKIFGFSRETGIEAFSEERGLVPNPQWKEDVFGEEWLIGNTYHTAIGQYGFQVTPLQVVKAVGAIANKGKLFRPTILKNKMTYDECELIDIKEEYFDVIQKGMREAILTGTAKGLNVSFVNVSAKTGTAERGVKKDKVNSWITGFFPSEKPKYAFVVIMEEGPVENQIGGLYVMRQMLEWMNVYTPEYFK
ncbi:MAG: penicillin-binding transpeptidase domain-containing protein [Patescibacteria group bacterium]